MKPLEKMPRDGSRIPFGECSDVGAGVVPPAASIFRRKFDATLVMGLNWTGRWSRFWPRILTKDWLQAARTERLARTGHDDTPGGLSDSMKDIIQHVLASPVPVAVYVGRRERVALRRAFSS
jgi:hypothetical protein